MNKVGRGEEEEKAHTGQGGPQLYGKTIRDRRRGRVPDSLAHARPICGKSECRMSGQASALPTDGGLGALTGRQAATRYMLIIITKPSPPLTPEENEVNRLAQVSLFDGARFTPVWAWCQSTASPGNASFHSDTQNSMLYSLSALPPKALNNINLKLQHPLVWRCKRVWPCHSDPTTLAGVMLTPETT